eukprot:GHVR01007963.1.p1 GENE.GHVR01007963.1~~GHVR01007963.1.p1  ORF type:complete len:176 (+),score=56.24 GHVR01007963.1:60-587(+)
MEYETLDTFRTSLSTLQIPIVSVSRLDNDDKTIDISTHNDIPIHDIPIHDIPIHDIPSMFILPNLEDKGFREEPYNIYKYNQKYYYKYKELINASLFVKENIINRHSSRTMLNSSLRPVSNCPTALVVNNNGVVTPAPTHTHTHDTHTHVTNPSDTHTPDIHIVTNIGTRDGHLQ